VDHEACAKFDSGSLNGSTLANGFAAVVMSLDETGTLAPPGVLPNSSNGGMSSLSQQGGWTSLLQQSNCCSATGNVAVGRVTPSQRVEVTEAELVLRGSNGEWVQPKKARRHPDPGGNVMATAQRLLGTGIFSMGSDQQARFAGNHVPHNTRNDGFQGFIDSLDGVFVLSTGGKRCAALQSLESALASVGQGDNMGTLQPLIAELGCHLGTRRMECGSTAAIHAVLARMVDPDRYPRDVDAYRDRQFGAKKHSYFRYKKLIVGVQLGYTVKNACLNSACVEASTCTDSVDEDNDQMQRLSLDDIDSMLQDLGPWIFTPESNLTELI
jgi:hypothetical protein